MSTARPGSAASALGEVIRRQRELSEISMRQFALAAGISNPYLSQIERGLREPSERVMDAIAQALQTSAETLYEQAGYEPEGDEPEASAVEQAIRADPLLTARQRQTMLTVYEALVASSEAQRPRRGRRRPTG